MLARWPPYAISLRPPDGLPRRTHSYIIYIWCEGESERNKAGSYQFSGMRPYPYPPAIHITFTLLCTSMTLAANGPSNDDAAVVASSRASHVPPDGCGEARTCETRAGACAEA